MPWGQGLQSAWSRRQFLPGLYSSTSHLNHRNFAASSGETVGSPRGRQGLGLSPMFRGSTLSTGLGRNQTIITEQCLGSATHSLTRLFWITHVHLKASQHWYSPVSLNILGQGAGTMPQGVSAGNDQGSWTTVSGWDPRLSKQSFRSAWVNSFQGRVWDKVRC